MKQKQGCKGRSRLNHIMYGDLGIKLVLAAKRAESLEVIPTYEADLIQSVLNENKELQRQIDGISEYPVLSTQTETVGGMESSMPSSALNTPARIVDSSFFSSSANNTPGRTSQHPARVQEILTNLPEFIRQMIIDRNKRCLIAYEMARLKKIDELVWNNVEVTAEQMADLSHNERVYLEKYMSLVSGVKSVIPEIDLGGELEPPHEVFIDVRVLKDAGEIVTEYGVFNLTKDSQFFVRRVDVERLIQQGYLKEI